MQGKPYQLGPLALTNTYTTNILNPGTTTGGVNGSGSPNGNLRIILLHVRIVNKTAASATFRLYRGATGANAAGTEIIGYDFPVGAYSAEDFYGQWVFDVADFLVGGASASTTLTIEGEGLIMVA